MTYAIGLPLFPNFQINRTVKKTIERLQTNDSEESGNLNEKS